MKNKLKKLFIDPNEGRFIMLFRYLFFGGTVTIINIILLYLLVEYLKFNYVLANVLSMIICIIITYILSKKFIFTKKVTIGAKKEFLSYVIIAIISIIIDTSVLNLLSEKFSIYYIISKIIATVISTGTNYILKKLIYNKYKEK